MLLLLVSGQRPQILRELKLSEMTLDKNVAVFRPCVTAFKQSRPGYCPPHIILKNYSNPRLCVFNHLNIYLSRTASLREGIDQLFITCKKPFKAATGNTISRWVKTLLKLAGVDTTRFSAGSARAASTSKAKEEGAPLSTIMQAAGWSRQSTFTKFYDKPLIRQVSLADFVLPKSTGSAEQGC